jgi:hypothetical protein
MSFDIHKYDNFDGELGEKALEKYVNALVASFLKSKEGVALLANDSDAGHWVRVFVDYGYGYEGVLPTQMTQMDVQEILTELFPRKVAISTKNETDDVILELMTFWKFMEREHHFLPAASILRFLEKLEPDFHGIMNDSSRFGMGKSIMSLGTELGFDMTNEADIQRFMVHYNEHIANRSMEPQGVRQAFSSRKNENLKRMCQSTKTKNQRKRMRQRKK